MKKISSEETEILGAVMKDGKMFIDREACLRINWLASGVLVNVGVDKDSGGWEKLYRDPADGRYWLLTYPHGEMQGGGPPALKQLPLTEGEVKEKYYSPAEWAKHIEQFMRERNIRFISTKDSSEETK
jgi:hypothetical protein